MAPKMRKISLVERIVFKNASVHDGGSFAVILACNGESDFLMCGKCGNGWIEPCRKKK
jgi:hypothetical protein